MQVDTWLRARESAAQNNKIELFFKYVHTMGYRVLIRPTPKDFPKQQFNTHADNEFNTMANTIITHEDRVLLDQNSDAEFDENAFIKQQKYVLMVRYGFTLDQINETSAKGLKNLHRYADLQTLRKKILSIYSIDTHNGNIDPVELS